MESVEIQIWVTWESTAANLFNSISGFWLSRKCHTKPLQAPGGPCSETANAPLSSAAVLESVFCGKSQDRECSWCSEELVPPWALRPSVRRRLICRLLGEENKNPD